MTPRYVSKNLVGAAVLVALGASAAFAQDTTKTRSQKRIPISKDSKPAAATKVDTVTQTVYKTDTLRLSSPPMHDTVRVAGPATTRVVHDTVMAAPPMAKAMRLPGGWYAGVAGGVSAPNRAIYDPNSAGPAGQVQLGWQGRDNPLGIRFDGIYTQPGDDSQYSSYQGNPSIINLSGDVKLALPWLRHLTGGSERFGLYLLGGGTYTMYKDLPIRLNASQPGGIPPVNVRVGPTDWKKNFGINYGAGASLAFGNKELFFETRIMDFTTDITPRVRQIPFMLGINFY